jgi:hypothetical protein
MLGVGAGQGGGRPFKGETPGGLLRRTEMPTLLHEGATGRREMVTIDREYLLD